MTAAHSASRARLVRDRARDRGASPWEVVQAISAHCGVSLLLAHRFANGWTQVEVTERLRGLLRAAGQPHQGLARQRVSSWERGTDTPSLPYLDALCQLYRTRSDRLGYGSDHSEPETPAAPDDPGKSEELQQLPRLLTMPGGLTGTAALFETLGSVRTRTDALLKPRQVSPADLDTWEELCDNYGRLQRTTPALTLLAQVTSDVAELRGILAHQPLEVRRRLYRVLAQLAGLVAITVNHISDTRESRAWLHTGRLAADETGDRALRAWITAHQGMLYLWYDRRAELAVELTCTAQAIAGTNPSAAAALALAMEARAQARLGRRREALTALHKAERMFERLTPADTRPTLLGFDPDRMRWYLQNALTSLGETEEALAMQREARQLSAVDLALVRMDRATCLIRAGDLGPGCRVAYEAYVGLPVESRAGLVRYRARAVAAMAQPHRRLGSVRALHDIVRRDGTPALQRNEDS
jgi:transcriptional regulator with XRE-family HTH domain